MTINLRRGILLVACFFFLTPAAFAETIVKLGLGSTGPDVKLEGGVLSTVTDGNNATQSPGDQDTTASFHGFVSGAAGIVDLNPPVQASFSLNGVGVVGRPFVVNQGAFSLVTQQTTGGTFELFDDNGQILLTGTLEQGSLHGTTGASATGGFLTANLGTFTGPSNSSLNKLFALLDPASASLAISLTDVSSPSGASGLSVINDELQDFTADATANVGAEAVNTQLPEPTSMGLALVAMISLLGFRRRR